MIRLSPTDRLFVLTGAGISAESGLPTFRGAGGVWRTYRATDLATPEAFARDPETVWQFYSWRRQVHDTCAPNAAHRALAELEKKLGARFYLCTQNVDELHERGGSQRVLHMHGELFRSRCSAECGRREPFVDRGMYNALADVPRCACGALIRPHVCWFGETPYFMDQIFRMLEQATVFVTIGSSGVVEPAASFAGIARHRGARTYYLGPEEPANVHAFDQHFEGTATELVPRLFQIG
jgi:NAD-dependent deacetylase